VRWPWQRRKRHTDTPSLEAKRRAEEDLERVRAKWPQVKARADSLRRGRERNGFGESMLRLFENGVAGRD
jgi:hypothetical protein